MLIFYSEAQAKPGVPAESPVDVGLEDALNIFHSLDTRHGFMGIPLTGPFVLQLLRNRNGVRVEVLDSSQPAVDSCEADIAFAERLIEAASKGQDVFQIARQTIAEWEHLDLG